jgi:hypothetical protein
MVTWQDTIHFIETLCNIYIVSSQLIIVGSVFRGCIIAWDRAVGATLAWCLLVAMATQPLIDPRAGVFRSEARSMQIVPFISRIILICSRRISAISTATGWLINVESNWCNGSSTKIELSLALTVRKNLF